MALRPIDNEKVLSLEVESGTAGSAAGSIEENQLGPTTRCEQFVPNGTQTGEDGPANDHPEIEIEASPAVESGTARSAAGSTGEEARPDDANAILQNDQRHRESSPFMDNRDAIIEIEVVISPAVGSGTARSAAGSTGEEARPVDDHEIDIEAATELYMASVTSGLGEIERERSVQAGASSRTIFRIPDDLRIINPEAAKPKLFSIGPYHSGREDLRKFEGQKWSFLRSFLRRLDSDEDRFLKSVACEASYAFGCYLEPKVNWNAKFMEMMLLDGCFVVELLLQICRKEDKIGEPNPILAEQEIIPELVRDLLKLENQVPYSFLERLFQCSLATNGIQEPHLWTLALRVFNMVYPELSRQKLTDAQFQHYNDIKNRKHKHLLDLFCFALYLTNSVQQNGDPPYRPRDKAIPSVTQLRPCGIKFKSKNTERFLDISFRKRVLEIPSIAINDFMITVLINGIALEQCEESSSKYITDYVSFMHCLIKHPEDSSLLCSDGIISTLSHDDQFVVKLFDGLGKGIVFNVNNCYLSKQFVELDSYYSSNWAYIIRTYCSSPWAAISVFSAILIIALTMTQTVYAAFGHHFR